MRRLLLTVSIGALVGCSPVKDTRFDEVDGGSDPVFDAAAPVGCVDNNGCAGNTPICDEVDKTCRKCGGATDCAESDQGELCSDSGACAECLEDNHCPAQYPVCDDELSCRGCDFHDECSSGVCEMATGLCTATANVVYVGGAGTSDSGICTKAAPCATINYGTGQLSVTRKTLLLAPGTYAERLLTPQQQVRIVGYDAIIDGAGLSISDTDGLVTAGFRSDTLIEGLEIKNSTSHGVYCQGDNANAQAKLTLREVWIENSASSALAHNQECIAHVEDSTISGSGASAINWRGGELTIERSELVSNPGTAVWADGTKLLLLNNLITNNGSNSYNRTISLYGDAATPAIVMRYNTIAFNAPGAVPTVQFFTTQQAVAFNSNIVWGNEADFDNVHYRVAASVVNNIIEFVDNGETIPPGRPSIRRSRRR